MANFTAADVKKLRELTGAGMMDCKKALDEADGDFDKAVEILRVKGAARPPSAAPSARPPPAWSPPPAARWSSSTARPTSSPRTTTSSPPRSRSSTPPTRPRPATSRRSRPSSSVTRPSARPSQDLADHHRREDRARPRRLLRRHRPSSYLHKRAADLPPAVGVLVEYDGDDADAARAVAMQIAAMRPQYLTRDEVPADVVAKEREIAEETAREEGKPEQAIAKIVEGRAERLLQGRRAARAAVGDREQEDRQGRPRRGRRHRDAVRPLRGRRLTQVGRLDRRQSAQTRRPVRMIARPVGPAVIARPAPSHPSSPTPYEGMRP